jgi:hypothetical protein
VIGQLMARFEPGAVGYPLTRDLIQRPAGGLYWRIDLLVWPRLDFVSLCSSAAAELLASMAERGSLASQRIVSDLTRAWAARHPAAHRRPLVL